METISVRPGQNIFDIAIQEYGSIEGIKNIHDNNDMSFTPDINPGDNINIDGNVLEKNTYLFLKLYPGIATGNKYEENVNEGIGYWIVGSDFIVS